MYTVSVSIHACCSHPSYCTISVVRSSHTFIERCAAAAQGYSRGMGPLQSPSESPTERTCCSSCSTSTLTWWGTPRFPPRSGRTCCHSSWGKFNAGLLGRSSVEKLCTSQVFTGSRLFRHMHSNHHPSNAYMHGYVVSSCVLRPCPDSAIA